jgi:hypothetical protein
LKTRSRTEATNTFVRSFECLSVAVAVAGRAHVRFEDARSHCEAVNDQRSHVFAIADRSRPLHHYDNRATSLCRTSCDLWAPSYPQKGNPLHIGREKREKASTGRLLELPRPMSPAIRIKVRPAESRGLKAGIRAIWQA